METRKFGNTDMHVSVLGMGGSELGHDYVDQETITQLINAAIDAGLNVVDTAECYDNSEERLGNAVSHRRKDFYILTKCGHNGAPFHLPDWDPKLIEKSIERSLRDLKTDYVDVLQFHGGSREMIEQGDVIRVVQNAKAAGKIRYIGYSGDGEMALYAINTGLFDTLQTTLNIADQGNLEKVLPAAKAKNMGVVVKRPMANAIWTKTREHHSTHSRPYFERFEKLDYDFLKDPARAAATALRFPLSSLGVHTAIVGTITPGRWKQNAAMLNPPLTIAEYNAIRERWKQVAGDDWVTLG